MKTEKITFFTEVELPPHCFLSEAIEWIAIGRVPQMQHYISSEEDEDLDGRFHWREMPDNFQSSYDYVWFERSEFESLGVPIDEAYFEAAEKCAFEYVHDLPDRIAEYEKRAATFAAANDESSINVYASLAADYREKLRELTPLQEFVDKVESSFDIHYDLAWAKVFQLLATGQIVCEVIDLARWEKCADEDDYKIGATFEDVSAASFSLGFDWRLDKHEIDGREKVALRVRTQDILSHREHLLQVGESVSVQRFGAFYCSNSPPKSKPRRSRGRPRRVDWSVLRQRLADMISDGSAPDGKESCIFELIAFAEKELGETPSRTAVQNNLKIDLDAHYAR